MYFGDNFDDVNNADTTNTRDVLVNRGQTATTYDPEGLLEFSQTYYWRIDEVNAPPDSTVFKGDVWSFSTLPLEAHFPNPEDGARNVPLDAQLSWAGGKGVIMHDLYFGTDEAAVVPAIGHHTLRWRPQTAGNNKTCRSNWDRHSLERDRNV